MRSRTCARSWRASRTAEKRRAASGEAPGGSVRQISTLEHRGKQAASETTLDDNSLSLALGGPLYQLYLRTRMARAPIELVWRRILILSAICWLPLFALACLNGQVASGVSIPFLSDVGLHVNFLLALPFLIGAEVVVHRRIPGLIRLFLDRGIIAPQDQARFQGLIAAVLRLRNSVTIEICMLLVVFTLGHSVWSHSHASETIGWYGFVANDRVRLTAAGYWYAYISLPILRFLLLRWYLRVFLWYRFLWSVQTLPMHLNLFHPDRAAGLGFLSSSMFAFAPILTAQAMVLAGVIGNRILYAGATLTGFKLQIIGAVLFLMLVVVAPLTFFAVKLTLARRIAQRELGTLSSRYVNSFRRKWVQGVNRQHGPLLGTADIQSLADLGNAFDTVSDMRILPFSTKTVLRLAIVVAAPLAPLTLTIVPLDRMVEGLVKLLL